MTKIEIFILTIRFCYIFLEKKLFKNGMTTFVHTFK